MTDISKYKNIIEWKWKRITSTGEKVRIFYMGPDDCSHNIQMPSFERFKEIMQNEYRYDCLALDIYGDNEYYDVISYAGKIIKLGYN